MDSNQLATKYLGSSLIIVIVGLIICLLASIGYNTYFSFEKEKIEVHAQNSNSIVH